MKTPFPKEQATLSGQLMLHPVRTPVGSGWLGLCDGAIVWLSLGKLDTAAVQAYWKGPLHQSDHSPVDYEELEEAARGKESGLVLAPIGTAFQRAVWAELRRIPFATTKTYGQIAERLGDARKARAVGSAVGANPIAWLIPCHRALPGRGGVGNYRWGSKAKAALLEWEGVKLGGRKGSQNRQRIEAMLLNAQRFKDLSRLSGSIAHDLNNLLAPIRMATELLRRKVDDPAAARYIEIIETSTGRARSVIQEILSFSRESESGDPQTIQAAEILQELEYVAKATFPPEVATHFDYKERAPSVCIDPHQLHRAVLNLLVNSRDAVGNRGHIHVRLDSCELDTRVCVGERCLTPGRYVCITVSDDGCGIPREIRGRIFDPFFTTKPKDKGTGLGLSSVFGIIMRAGGFIDLESEEGKGTTFHLFLPEAAGTGQS